MNHLAEAAIQDTLIKLIACVVTTNACEKSSSIRSVLSVTALYYDDRVQRSGHRLQAAAAGRGGGGVQQQGGRRLCQGSARLHGCRVLSGVHVNGEAINYSVRFNTSLDLNSHRESGA